jgi:hypothetical protein
MRIRYGCALGLVVNQPTPAFCLVDIHPERRHDVLDEQPLRAEPALPFRTGYDTFGNIMQRCLFPPRNHYCGSPELFGTVESQTRGTCRRPQRSTRTGLQAFQERTARFPESI